MGWDDDDGKKWVGDKWYEKKRESVYGDFHTAQDGTEVNKYGYDKYGNSHSGYYQPPKAESSGSPVSLNGALIILGICCLGVLGYWLLKYIAANKEFFIIILAIAVASAIACIAIHIKAEKKALKTFIAILIGAAMMGVVIYIGPAQITGYFNSLKQNSALLETQAQTPDSSLQETSEQTPATLTFPRTGTWDLAGHDSENWTAKMVIDKINNNDFSGYFEWRDQDGREYFRGVYDPQTRKVEIKDYRLVNATSIGLGSYEAFLTEDNNNFESGTWTGDGVWEAIWRN
jgi:hypothetical protein